LFLSLEEKTQMSTSTAKASTALTPEILAAAIEKRGKFVLDLAAPTTTDEVKGALAKVIEVFVAKGRKFFDWTEKAPDEFTTLAIVNIDEGTGENENGFRLVSIPSMAVALADPIVARALYKSFVTRVVGRAAQDDADPADFVIASGTYRQGHDATAFQSQASAYVSALKEKGLSGITVKLLRDALANAAFARSQFPRMPEGAWTMIIDLMEQAAKDKGADTSIFTHWRSTRDVKVDVGAAIDMGDFAKVAAAKVAEKAEKDGPTDATGNAATASDHDGAPATA